ncbi:MAG TPA: hypothetical protein ENH10_02150, partial [Bacteroidetes bacterium]|nr:hypothetical protein [Bacteroidota bacterium]HEX03943.1 hypothetical protein [Bacteroidota bacterium]
MRSRYESTETFDEFMDIMVMRADEGVRRMWVGEGAAYSFALPKCVWRSKWTELVKKTPSYLAGSTKKFGLYYLATANMWLRAQKDANGIPIEAAQKLANIFHTEPGQIISDKDAPLQQVPIRDANGEYAYTKDGKLRTRWEAVKFGLLEEQQRAASPFVHRLSQIAMRIDHKVRRLKGAEKKAAIKAEELKIIELLQAELTDKQLKKASLEAYHIRVLLRDTHGYLKQHIPNIGFIENYFPQVFDETYLMDHRQEFVDMLADEWGKKWLSNRPHVKEVPDAVSRAFIEKADRAHRRIVEENGSPIELMADKDLSLDHLQPGFGFDKERMITDIDKEILAPFLSKDLSGIMTNYIRSAAKRAESDRRFGRFSGVIENKKVNGRDVKVPVWEPVAELERLEAEYKAAGVTRSQARKFNDTVRALRGQLGADFDPRLRTVFSAVMTYQNFRVLAFAMLASIPDAGGIFIRSKDFRFAWQSMRKNMRDIVDTAWNEDATLGGLEGRHAALHKMAASIGSISERMNHIALAEQYGSNYQGEVAQKFNDFLFHWNGLQFLTKFTRVMSASVGMDFIEHHAALAKNENKTSQRYLDELGVSAADVDTWVGRGRPAWGIDEGTTTTDKNAEKIAQAINRFVNQSVLRPDSSMRPSWGSDPRFMLIFHLKSFMYSFHEQILKGIHAEVKARHGTNIARQYAPVMVAVATLLPLAFVGL